MEFFMPTKVYSEENCIQNKGEIFQQCGTKAMIVTGKHSSKMNGSFAQVEQQLKKYEISYVTFDQIEENPSIETVESAAKLGIENEVDFVIGIGGGSPMDAAKAIALLIANPSLNGEALYQAIPLSYLPVVEIPTTAGTGSEVTPWSILTIHKKRTKQSIAHRIYPKAALIDASFLEKLPRNVLVSTAVDTLCHLVESYLVVKASDYSRIFSLSGLRKWGSLKENLLKETFTKCDYEAMMQASTLGGIAITHTGTGLPHALSYRITYETGISHGIACGISLAGFVKNYYDKKQKDDILSALGFESMEKFTDYLTQLMGTIQCPKEVWESAVDGLWSNQAKLATYPVEISKQTIIEYFQ